jgi:hypothetical protein
VIHLEEPDVGRAVAQRASVVTGPEDDDLLDTSFERTGATPSRSSISDAVS